MRWRRYTRIDPEAFDCQGQKRNEGERERVERIRFGGLRRMNNRFFFNGYFFSRPYLGKIGIVSFRACIHQTYVNLYK